MGSPEGARKSREIMREIRADPIVRSLYRVRMRPKIYSTELTERQRSLIYGTLLGDGNIRIPCGCMNPLLQFDHSIKQKEYLMYKYSELSNLCKSPPTEVNRFEFGKSIRFQTTTLRCLNIINDTVKVLGRKCVTDRWIEEMSHKLYSGLSLAMWYLDDGCINQIELYPGRKITNSMTFCLGDRTQEEASLLKEWIKNEFGVDSRIYIARSRKCKNGESLKNLVVSKKKNMMKLIETISLWASRIPSMDYKLKLIYANRK